MMINRITIETRKLKTLQKNKQAQVWSLDVIVGITIFSSAIILFYVFAVNFSHEAQEVLAELENDGVFVSSNLLSEGAPRDWNLSNVKLPGISNDNRLNQTKLELFYQLNQNYNKTKRLLNTRFDIYFFLNSPMIVNGTLVDGFGKPGLNRTSILSLENPRHIIKMTRYVIYQSEPVILTLYLWEK